MLPLYEDFTERELHLWLYKTHNPHALQKQFPQYSLPTLYRVRKGHRAKYMPYRVYKTLKGIMDFAEHHRREAGKLKFTNLADKYDISECTVGRFYKEWKGTL